MKTVTCDICGYQTRMGLPFGQKFTALRADGEWTVDDICPDCLKKISDYIRTLRKEADLEHLRAALGTTPVTVNKE